MARRITFPILFACILLASSGAQAQEWNSQNNTQGPLPALFSFKRSGNPNRTQYGGPTDAAIPVQYPTARNAVPGVPYYGPDGIVHSRVPIQPEWNDLTPLEATLQAVFQKSWYRLEWMQWQINRPGTSLLGAPLNIIGRPQDGFPVFDLQTPPNVIGGARVATLDPIAMRDTNGLRGTIGLPTSFGAIEANFFALEQASDSFRAAGLKPQQNEFDINDVLVNVIPGRFIATSLLENGQPSDLVELYNREFEVTYRTDVLGAEINFIRDDLIEFGLPGGVEIHPMFGYRFLMIQEEIQQAGQFQDVTGAVPLLTSLINSSTSNNLFGPSIGTRIEFQHERFTLGFNPKFTLATNVYRARVRTERFRLAADPTVVTEDRSVSFSPIGELQTYARIRVTDSMWVSVGYSLLYISRLTRPHDNVFYNDNGAFPTPPGVVLKTRETYMRIDGLTLGVEIILP
jgi:hypothetical protein